MSLLGLLAYRLRMMRGALLAEPRRALLLVGAVALGALVINHGGEELARLLQRVELDGPAALELLFAVVIGVGALVAGSACVLGLVGAPQLAELDNLRALPLPPERLYRLRCLDQLPAVLAVALLTLPATRWVTGRLELAAPEMAALVAGQLLTLLLLQQLLSAAVILCVCWLPGWVLRGRALLGSAALVAIAVWLGWRPLSTLVPWRAALSAPARWTMELIAADAQQGPLARGLISWTCALALAWTLAERLFVQHFYPRLDAVIARLQPRTGLAGADAGPQRSPAWRQRRAVWRVEWLRLKRDRALQLTLAMSTVIVALPGLMIIALAPSHRVALLPLYWIAIGALALITLGGLAANSIGREGSALGSFGWLPISDDQLLRGRARAYGLAFCPLVAGWLGGWWALSGGAPSLGARLLVLAIAVSAGAAFARLLVDAGAIFATAAAAGEERRRLGALGVLVCGALGVGLTLTAVAVAVAVSYLGLAALPAWLAAMLVWGPILAVLRANALIQLRQQRRSPIG